MENFTAVLMMEVTNQDHQHVIEDFSPHIENLGWKKIASDIFVFKKEFENCHDSCYVESKCRDDILTALDSSQTILFVDYAVLFNNEELFKASINTAKKITPLKGEN